MAKKNNTFGRFTAQSGESEGLPFRGRNYYMPQPAPKDTVGINLKSVTGQVKSNLWDLFRSGIYSYLERGDYSEDEFKGFLQNANLRVPVDLPGDYGIDFDINRRDPSTGIKDDYRITLKKEF